MDSLERGDIPMECCILWSKRLGSWLNLTQRLTRVVLTQVEEICQFSLLGNGISKLLTFVSRNSLDFIVTFTVGVL
jgi:hypothetical protein